MKRFYLILIVLLLCALSINNVYAKIPPNKVGLCNLLIKTIKGMTIEENFCVKDDECYIAHVVHKDSLCDCGIYMSKSGEEDLLMSWEVTFFETCIRGTEEEKIACECAKLPPPICIKHKCVASPCEVNKVYKFGECECSDVSVFEPDWEKNEIICRVEE